VAHLIDTNIAIHARDGDETVLARLDDVGSTVLLSALSLAELRRGLFKDPLNSAIRRARTEILLQAITVLPFDAAAAEAYGRIIAHCGWSGAGISTA
jgi:tRNA(fMet)-specific endonuclease VapC